VDEGCTPWDTYPAGGSDTAVQLAPPSAVRAKATQVLAGHDESMPMTKPVVADTKVTDPGSNPLGTVVPAGRVTLGTVEVIDVVVVVVDRKVVRGLVQAPVAIAKPSTTTDSAFEGFLTEPPWLKVPSRGRDRSHNRLHVSGPRLPR